MSKTVTGIVTWLKDWFVENTDSRLTDNRNFKTTRLSPTQSNPLNLNNFTENGFYYVLGNNANVPYVANLPYNWGNNSFYLLVEDTNDATYKKQTITDYGARRMCIRTKWGAGWSRWYEVGLTQIVPPTYLINDTASADNSSTLFGDSIALRNNGTNSTAWNSGGYYTLTNTSSQKESMRVLTALTGETQDFCIEYDSYVQGSNGSSGFVIYNSSTSWEKLTDDADSNKKYWYGYNDGSFHETSFNGNTVTNQKWVHYKYTLQGSTFTMEVTYNNSTVVTRTETIHLTRGSTTKYGLDSEWQSNTVTRYKNLKAYYI